MLLKKKKLNKRSCLHDLPTQTILRNTDEYGIMSDENVCTCRGGQVLSLGGPHWVLDLGEGAGQVGGD